MLSSAPACTFVNPFLRHSLKDLSDVYQFHWVKSFWLLGRIHDIRSMQVSLSMKCPHRPPLCGLITRRPVTYLWYAVIMHCWESCRISVQWCHFEPDGVSNHQPHNCLLKRLFKRRSKKTLKLRVTGLCDSPATGEFPAQRASSTENVFIWWRHHMMPTNTAKPRPTWFYVQVNSYDKKIYLLVPDCADHCKIARNISCPLLGSFIHISFHTHFDRGLKENLARFPIYI